MNTTTPCNSDVLEAEVLRLIVKKRDAEIARLRAALEAVIEWREGPEGPDIFFNQGAKMIDKVRAALEGRE